MRQLHVVGLSEDGRSLLLAPGPADDAGPPVTSSFRVPVDARLHAALRGQLPAEGSTAPPAADVSPKLIQARLRAGETVEQIARSAGVPASRVARFAGPVENEKARVVAAAREAVLTRARRGASATSLGEAVRARLARSQVDPSEVRWDARRQPDGAWVVDVAYSTRGRRRRSAWRFDPATGELAAVDASSAVLGYVEPGAEQAAGTAGPVTQGRTVHPAAGPTPSPRRRTAASPPSPQAAVPVRVPAAARLPGAVRTAAPAASQRVPTPGTVRRAQPALARVTAPAARTGPRPPAGARSPAAARSARTAAAGDAGTAPAAAPAPAARPPRRPRDPQA